MLLSLLHRYAVLDLTKGDWEGQVAAAGTEWVVGRYDEVRVGVYNTPLFGGVRNVHIGIDIGGPVGTPVLAVSDGIVHSAGCEMRLHSLLHPPHCIT